MFSTSARPHVGHKFFATLSFYFSQDAKFDRTRQTNSDLKRGPKQLRETPLQPGKQPLRSLFVPATLALSFAVLGIAGCGVEKGTTKLTDSATLVANPASVDFGSVNIGTSGNQKISLANTGPDAVQITQLTVSDDTFNVDGEGALPVSLAPGSTLSFKVHFNPKKSADSTGEVSVIAATATAAAAKITLHGKGASPANPATASLSALTCTKPSMTATGSDTCNLALTSAASAGGLAVSLQSSSSAITVPSSVTIAAGASSASFTATVVAVKAQTVTLTAKQGTVSKTATIQLGATTTSSAVAAALSGISCGSTSIAGTLADTCTVNLSASAPASGFKVTLASSNSAVKVPSSITVPASAASATFTANVSAVGTSQSATLTATGGGISQRLSLQLKPGTAALAINATSIAFGSTSLNKPTSQTLKLTSTGSASVTIKSVTIAGSGFTISRQTFPVTLSPGQSLSLDLLFNPTTTGSVTGQLTVTSTASSNAITSLSLTGTGTAHKVTLTWDPPNSKEAIAGYNIYRALTSATSYQRLNSIPNTSTAFTDSNVLSGKSYDYLVRTVDASGTESSPSNKTTVTIP